MKAEQHGPKIGKTLQAVGYVLAWAGAFSMLYMIIVCPPDRDMPWLVYLSLSSLTFGPILVIIGVVINKGP